MTGSMLRLYNTRTHSVEPFTPLVDDTVRMYVCGLTPSAEAHLGHARSFLFFDILRRYLRHPRNGYRVRYVRNVTDIDDRSIATAHAEGRRYDEVVNDHFTSFQRSMRRLFVEDPDDEPHATDYIAEILEMIDALVDRGAAYASADGVYFSVARFPRYGALSNRNVDELLIGARIAVDEQKRDPLDFALWKFAKPGEPSWPSRYGAGRPGWHIECSAMSHALLREPFDIHGGGYDLIFPHHENEIAQTETFLGHGPMANVWMHGGLLLFDNRKMSKSLGNFEPLSALLDRLDPLAIRFLFLQTGYRKPMNFTDESIVGAAAGLQRLQKAAYRLSTAGRSTTSAAVPERIAPVSARFFDQLDDDVNTAGALGVLFELAGDDRGAAADVLALLREAAEVLGIENAFSETALAACSPEAVQRRAIADREVLIGRRYAEPAGDALTEAPPEVGLVDRLKAAVGDIVSINGGGVTTAVEAVIAARNAARSSRDFALADRLRQALAAERIVLKDAKDGTTWTIDG